MGKRLVLRGGGGGPVGGAEVCDASIKALRSGEIARGPLYADVSVSERLCSGLKVGDKGTFANLSDSVGTVRFWLPCD
jgi:hypothetical protein